MIKVDCKIKNFPNMSMGLIERSIEQLKASGVVGRITFETEDVRGTITFTEEVEDVEGKD